ncbi:replication/maintenance protein RepL [uncultured Campylobacter sp.]|uniref:replication/maintenance protein RepL n=1 Tax=uncultured Campylobacter sp. TaxID=218934 RepID=UPI0026148440|nr:replication/maintenance protein RepL [uncultured Campylobacter sp.]
MKINKELEDRVLEKIIGHKKLQIIYHLCSVANKDGFIFITIDQICEMLDVSKPTVIKTLSLLSKRGAIKRVKNGLYQISL